MYGITALMPVFLVPRCPGLVIAGCLRTAAARQRRAGRPIGCWRPGHVWHMRLLPFARLIVLFGRWNIHNVMNPAMPFRRNAAGFRRAIVDHPAPLEAKRRVDLPAARPVIAVTLAVLADQFAKSRGPKLRTEGLAIPPGKEFEEKLLHCRKSVAGVSRTLRKGSHSDWLDAIPPRSCPANRGQIARPGVRRQHQRVQIC